MAFSFENSKGVTYYLHGKARETKSGKTSWLYYFAKEEKPEGGLDAVPAGYQVVENKNDTQIHQVEISVLPTPDRAQIEHKETESIDNVIDINDYEQVTIKPDETTS